MDETFLRFIIDNIPAPIVYWDHQQRCIYANRICQEWFGLKEFFGKSMAELLGNETYQLNQPYIELALKGQKQFFERDFTLATGEKKTIFVHYIPDRNGDNINGVTVLVQDITEIHQAQLALENFSRFQNSILHGTQAAIIATDTRGTITLFNSGAEAMLGIPADELVGRTTPFGFHDWDEIVARATEQSRNAGTEIEPGLVFARALAHQEREQRQWTWIRRDGKRLQVMLQTSALHGVDGEISGYLGVAIDITARTEAETALRSSEEKLRRLFDLSPLGIARNTLDGRFIEANQALLDMVGHSRDSFLKLSYGDLTPADYEIDEQHHMATLAAEGRYGPYEKEYLHRDGHRVPVRLSGVVVTDPHGEKYSWSIIEDISESKRVESQTLLASSVFQSTDEGIIVAAPDTTIVSVNPAFTQITGFSAEEAIGNTPRLLKSDRQDQHFYAAMWTLLSTAGQWQGQIWNRRKDGTPFLAWQTISAVKSTDGTILHYVSVFNDITELHRKEEHIRFHAYHDALTGLPNRQLLIDRLGQEIERSRRTGKQVAVMFMDLDRFKVVNDSLGHNVGDELLIEVSGRLETSVRKSDTVGRWGGDEFIVVLSDFASIGDVADVAKKIIDQTSEPMDLRGHDIRVGASIGIAIYPQDGSDSDELLKHADLAMYRSKAAGRGGFHFFHQSMNAHAVERLELEASLRQAIDKGEFELYFQPKINILFNKVDGAEALIRWNHPTLGVVPPNRFIPLAEETGLILPLGDWVIGQACRQLREWRDSRTADLCLAVNLSARQFLDPDLPERLATHLRNNDLSGQSLEVELTESAVMTDPARAVQMLERIRDLGVSVSVDDFGTGYSSLAYLKRFPINAVKIDRSFINEITSDPDAAAIVRTIVTLSRTLNLKSIAEGVESEEQMAVLRELGCTSAQGFLFSRPLPAGPFIDWLEHRKTLTGPSHPRRQDLVDYLDCNLDDIVGEVSKSLSGHDFARTEALAALAHELLDIPLVVSNLVDSLALGHGELFVHHVAWLTGVFWARHLSAEVLDFFLGRLFDVILARIPHGEAEFLRLSLAAVKTTLEDVRAAIKTSYLEGNDLAAELARAYLGDLLAQRREQAINRVVAAVDGGLPLQEVYLDVFQRCQREAGRLWENGRIGIADEHYCSAATQAAMSRLSPYVEAMAGSAGRDGRRAIAACVSGEHHEIGIRFVADFLRMEGWQVAYFGGNLPSASLISALCQQKPDLLALSANTASGVRRAKRAIQQIRDISALNHLKILVGGQPFNLVSELWSDIGADGTAPSAGEAPGAATRLIR